jgi:hypothetical protein
MATFNFPDICILWAEAFGFLRDDRMNPEARRQLETLREAAGLRSQKYGAK